MKLSTAGAGLLALALVALGWAGRSWLSAREAEKARRQLAVLQQAADSLRGVAAHRDTVNVTRLVTARGRTDSILQTDTLFSRDTVRVIVQAERAACDTALAGKDSTIAELTGNRDDALEVGHALATSQPSRFVVATVVLPLEPARRLAVTGTYRLTRLWHFDINVGLGWRP